jgi:RNA polymerase sigma-70 factor (ECF subfamily)
MMIQETSTDAEIVRRILNGDKKAFEYFIRIHQRLVYHVVRGLIPDSSAWEDVCQDVFLRIYQNLSSFRFECKLSSWAAKVARNTCLNELAKKRPTRFNDGAAGEGGGYMDAIPSHEPSPESVFADKDASKRLRDAIGSLPEIQRTALTLYHLEEMSCQEIAEAMDVPENTVKSHLFRARQTLRLMISKRYRKEELCQAI